MSIRYITFEVSGRCNMNCPFCFSDWRTQSQEMSTADAKKCIALFKEQGLEAINFTGGEPLMRQDIVELLTHAKQLGIITILTTNGILVEQQLPGIAPLVDFIGLPLDSADATIHNALRPTPLSKNHQQLVLDLLALITSTYPHIGIKINTIVTRKNMQNLPEIGNLLKGKVVSWKLSHFTAGGHSTPCADEFSVSAREYLDVVAQCRRAHPDINIVSAIAHERDDCCRIISSIGNLLQPTKAGLENLGQVLSLPSELISKGFNQPKNERVLRQTYVHK
ncbi:MAG: radical SAM protein [archaeon]